MRRSLFTALACILVLSSPVNAAPISEMTPQRDYYYRFGNWADESGVSCLSDENYWIRWWVADKFTGVFSASVYLCPYNPNAPAGPDNVDIWAAFDIADGGRGVASLTLTYPDGTVVPARLNPTTGFTEVCVVRHPTKPAIDARMAGVYTLTFTANLARSPIVHLQTDFAESVRGQYWWGCDLSWWE